MVFKDKTNILLGFLLLIGFSLLLYPIYESRFVTTTESNTVISSFEENLTLEEKSASSFSMKEQDNDVIGVIYIPDISVKLPIYYGISEYALSKGVGSIPSNSDFSGTNGTNAAVSSHNGLSTQGLFTNLSKLSQGDKFYIKNLEGTILEYEVFDIHLVRPDDVSVLNPIEDKALATLITCEDVEGPNSHRRIVVGEVLREIGPYESKTIEKINTAKAPLSTYEITALSIIFGSIVLFIVFKCFTKKRKKEAN